MRAPSAIIACLIWCCSALGQQHKGNEPLKLVGDETSLIRVKAETRTYVGKEIILTGSAQVSDYYNYGYINAQDSYYALDFRQFTGAKDFGESCHLYLRRDFGKGIIETILSKTIDKKADLVMIRAKAVLDPKRFLDGDYAWSHLELLDVQFRAKDEKDWGPWILEEDRKSVVDAEAKRKMAADEAERERTKQREALAEQERAARTRTWSDKPGRSSVVAEYRGMVGEHVLLRKKDGKTIKVPRDRLSDADQKWLDDTRKGAKRKVQE